MRGRHRHYFLGGLAVILLMLSLTTVAQPRLLSPKALACAPRLASPDALSAGRVVGSSAIPDQDMFRRGETLVSSSAR